MSDNQNIGAVQWRILIDRCPENVKKMINQYTGELRLLLESYPTAAITLMDSGHHDQATLIAEALKNIARLRVKITEVDLILENSINMLSGYLVHLDEKDNSARNIPGDAVASGEVSIDDAFEMIQEEGAREQSTE